MTVCAPDFWNVRAGGPRALSGTGSDETRDVAGVIGLQPVANTGVRVGFISPRGVSTFAQARDYPREIWPFLVKNPDASGMTRRKIGGLPAATLAGTGR